MAEPGPRKLKDVKEMGDAFFTTGRSQLKAAGRRDGLIPDLASMPLAIKRIGPGLAAS
jgi:hypothetical protein